MGLSLWYFLFRHLSTSISFHWKGERATCLFLFSFFPFLLESCLKLHEPPRWPSRSTKYNFHVFSVFASILSIAFRTSFWVPFPSCCSFKIPVFVAGIEIVVPYSLLHITANHFFQSSITGRFSFLHCILQIRCHKRFQFLCVMENCLYKYSLKSSCGTVVMERRSSSHLVEALHVDILQLYSW